MVLHTYMHRQSEDEYMISDYDLFVNKYISVPRDMGQLTCAAFVAGVVKGVLEGAGFPAGCECGGCVWNINTRTLCIYNRVTAYVGADKDQLKPKTTIVMKFDASVMQREARTTQG